MKEWSGCLHNRRIQNRINLISARYAVHAIRKRFAGIRSLFCQKDELLEAGIGCTAQEEGTNDAKEQAAHLISKMSETSGGLSNTELNFSWYAKILRLDRCSKLIFISGRAIGGGNEKTK